MKNLYVDCNSRTVQVSRIGIGLDVSAAGVVTDIPIPQFVRVKAVGGDARIKQNGDAGDAGDGVLLSKGETEYFFLERQLELVSGQINVMY